MSISALAEPITAQQMAPSIKVATPSVSVIVPCYNEERFIGTALENLARQYQAKNYEIILVDGMSEDRTRHVIAEFQQLHPDLNVRILENRARTIPQSLNLGIEAASGEIIARIDAHAAPSPNYIRRCVEVLSQHEAEIVGMPCRVQPGSDTAVARAIAIAVSHRFGIGDAKYRLHKGRAQQEAVDTVAFACFRKSLWEKIGGYDETLLTNEDYDFNYRARLQGHRVILDRSEHCDYFARATFAKLAAQYFRYGRWKARMIKQRPRSIKIRHLVAPTFVASILLLSALGLSSSYAWFGLVLVMVAYLIAAAVFAVQGCQGRRETLPVLLLIPLAFFTIHLAWGTSFLLGLVGPHREQNK